MKVTRQQLRRIIREAIEGPDGIWYDDYGNRIQQDDPNFITRRPAGAGGAISPEAFADQNGLQLDVDNEGQKIIYLDNEQADRLDMPPGVNWDVEQLADGWVIYTGEYEAGWDEHPEQEQARREIEDEEASAAGRPWEHN